MNEILYVEVNLGRLQIDGLIPSGFITTNVEADEASMLIIAPEKRQKAKNRRSRAGIDMNRGIKAKTDGCCTNCSFHWVLHLFHCIKI